MPAKRLQPALPSLRRPGLVSHTVLTSVAFGATLFAGEGAGAQSTQTLPPVSVEADRPTGLPAPEFKVDQSASPKLTEPLRNTPQSINVVPRSVLDQQGITTLREALRNVPGTSIVAGEGGGPQGDNLRIRGFTANNDLYIDGLRDIAQYNRDPFNTEQIEVQKGPSSTFFGRGSTGGSVNLISKEPTLDSFYGGTVGFGTDTTKRFTGDVNQGLDTLGMGGAAVRLNFMYHDNEVADRDVVEYQRWAVAPSFAVGIGTPTRFTLSYLHQQEDNVPDYGLPILNGAVPPVDRSNWYGFKGLQTEETKVDMVTGKFEHDFSKDLSVRNQTRFVHDTRFAIVSPPRNASAVTDSLTRNPTGRDSVNEAFINQTDVTVKFDTAGLQHTVVTGVEFGRETYDNQAITFAGAATDSLFSPNPNTPFTGTRTNGTKTNTTTTTLGLFALDTIKIGRYVELVGGMRWDRFDADVDSTPAGAATTNFGQVDEEFSWRGAIVGKPASNGSVYFSYATSFNPSAEALTLAANTTGVDPESNRLFEIGTKWDVLAGRLSLSGALFRIDKTNARTPDPLGGTVQVLDGEQRVQGFEIGFTGRITEQWNVIGGYAYLDGEIIRSNTANETGKTVPNTPEHAFSLWTTYDLPYNFQIGGGVQYASSRYTNNTNTGKVDSYWLFDATVAYHVTENIDIRVNGYNLTDEFYIERIHGGGAHLVPGAGRSVLVSTAFRF
ncbi:MAG: TonB-dependent receptor [Rhodospirillales bacterium]